jgi:hypothetical protein
MNFKAIILSQGQIMQLNNYCCWAVDSPQFVGCLSLDTLHLHILGAYLLIQDLHSSLKKVHIPLKIVDHCRLTLQLFLEVCDHLQQLLSKQATFSSF